MNISERTFNPLLAGSFRYQQSENSDLKYNGNWGPLIQPANVSTSTWTIEDGSVTLSNEALSGNKTSVLITGSVGEATIVNKVVLDDGQTEERTIKLKIIDNSIPRINYDYGYLNS
jgi:hypothetical protein